MSRVVNWRRMFADLGWAMAITDPTCYSYYLASRTYRISQHRARDIEEPRPGFPLAELRGIARR
jgi:hypothetical protein